MGIKCPQCRSDNSDTQRFCGECGAPLDAASAVPASLTKTIETPCEELITGSTFAGRYQIIEELGHGGMGRVYRALDKKINEEVALKLIKPEIASERRTLERFANELKAARRIAHKNVGRMFHLSEDKGAHYITMEYVPGEDLRRMIRMSRQLSIGTAIDIARQIAEGLAEAHRQGIVHRDLKPGNIMIDREGNAKIMDFGIARLLASKGITGAGVAVGTPEYMSPEQVDGKEADPRADIYSAGIILYEMATGRVPFEAETPYAIGFKQKNERPASPKALNPQVPDDLSDLILRCLEKDPAARPQTAEELRLDLERMQKGLPTTGHATPAAKRKPLSSREITIKFTVRKLVVPGLAFAALIAAAVLAVLLLSHRAPDQKTSPSHKQITFSGNSSIPALSPDGKFLAYTDFASVNEQRVIVQDIVGGQTLEVSRGWKCIGLRWSPDGSELSFYVKKNDGTWTTRVVPRLGGKAREFDRIQNAAAWSPDGTQFAHWSDDKKQIVLTNKSTGESKSIPLGKPLPANFDDLDWSPSGKFIALSMYDDKDIFSIWTVSVDGKHQNKIIEDPKEYVGSPRWSPRGDAVYYLHRRNLTTNIWKMLISADTGKPSKPPRPVLEGHEVGGFTLTKDGKSLAYTRENWCFNLWLASLDGSGKDQKVSLKQLTTGTMNTIFPNFSPDGKLIVFTRGKITADLFVMPAEGGPSQQITFMDSWNWGPVWSADGQEIAFASTRGGASKIWKVGAAGGPPQQFDKAEGDSPTWAPGRMILYQTLDVMSSRLLDPGTGEVAPLLTADSALRTQWPIWSPDGKKIAVQWTKPPETTPGIWIHPLDRSPDVMLRRGPATLFGWSKDGKLIYAWEATLEGGNVLAISAESGKAEVLFKMPLTSETGALATGPHTVDGKHFVFSGRKIQSDVWVVENFDPDIK